MSEYQYYEFRALDRRLTAEQQQRLRSLSSRAEISATRLANEYSFGDFRGDPGRLLECLRTAAFPKTPAACANISLNDSDHAACPSPARTRASSITASMPQAWLARTVRSRHHADHSSLL